MKLSYENEINYAIERINTYARCLEPKMHGIEVYAAEIQSAADDLRRYLRIQAMIETNNKEINENPVFITYPWHTNQSDIYRDYKYIRSPHFGMSLSDVLKIAYSTSLGRLIYLINNNKSIDINTWEPAYVEVLDRQTGEFIRHDHTKITAETFDRLKKNNESNIDKYKKDLEKERNTAYNLLEDKNKLLQTIASKDESIRKLENRLDNLIRAFSSADKSAY